MLDVAVFLDSLRLLEEPALTKIERNHINIVAKLICIIVVRYIVNNMISYEFFRHQDFSDMLFCTSCLSSSLVPDYSYALFSTFLYSEHMYPFVPHHSTLAMGFSYFPAFYSFSSVFSHI